MFDAPANSTDKRIETKGRVRDLRRPAGGTGCTGSMHSTPAPRARLQHIGDLPYALLYGPGPCLLNPSHGRATGFWGLVMAKPLRGTPGSVLTCATTTRNRVLVFKMTTYTCSLPWFVRLEVPYAILVHLPNLGPFGGFPPYLWCRFPTRRACALPNWTVSASRFPMRVNYPEECSCR
jgi:hypothetical protein